MCQAGVGYIKLFNDSQTTEWLFLNVSVLLSARLLDEKYKGSKNIYSFSKVCFKRNCPV